MDRKRPPFILLFVFQLMWTGGIVFLSAILFIQGHRLGEGIGVWGDPVGALFSTAAFFLANYAEVRMGMRD